MMKAFCGIIFFATFLLIGCGEEQTKNVAEDMSEDQVQSYLEATQGDNYGDSYVEPKAN